MLYSSQKPKSQIDIGKRKEKSEIEMMESPSGNKEKLDSNEDLSDLEEEEEREKLNK